MKINKKLLMSQIVPNSEIANYDVIYSHFGLLDKINMNYNTDGWCKGCIIEHKLNLGSLTDGLSKAKKELVRYNEILEKNGEYKAYHIIALDQTNGNCYVFKYDEVNNPIELFNAYDDPDKFLLYINAEMTVKYEVTILNVVAISEKFYTENPKLRIRDFFNYIRDENDKVFKWKGREEDFAFIMDELTDPAAQKILGRFYTPERYTSISMRYVKNAIDDVSKRYKDYVIIDRCAGTGNLQICFEDDEIITHMILNTIEWKEYIALLQRFSKYKNKPRAILPPAGVTYEDVMKTPQEIQQLMNNYVIVQGLPKNQSELVSGTLNGGDALSEDFLDNFEDIFKKRDKKEIGIIILENPPYADTGDTTNKSNVKGKTTSWVKTQGIKKGINGNSLNELSNQFIWSAMEYFKPDHLIVYSPIKYWKSNHIMHRQSEELFDNNIYEPTFVEGYLCNRLYFHATESAISLIHWKNNPTESYSKLTLDSDLGTVEVKKVYNPISKLYPKEKKANDNQKSLNTYNFKWSYLVNPLRSFFTDDITKNDVLIRGVELTTDNILEIVPLFCANNPDMLENYTEKDVLMCTADGEKQYLDDHEFVNDCLLYSLLTNRNKTSDLSNFYEYGFKIFQPRNKHKELIKIWNEIYEKTKTFGVDNIEKDDKNFEFTMDRNNKKIKQWKDPQLGDAIKRIKSKLKDFYMTEIKQKMLDYELVK